MNHYHDTIQGWFDFADLYAGLVKRAESPAHFVEVGAWKGASTAFMGVEIINSGKDIQFDVVDTWQGSKELRKNMPDDLFATFTANLAAVQQQLGERFRPIKSRSVEAADAYEDASLDFVFIDGSHRHQDVLDDISAWRAKVKPGGVLAGHDYASEWGVMAAVQASFPNEPIETVSHNCWYRVM